MDEVAEVRAFSRFYTRAVGALDAGHLETPFTLSEARLIYEVASRGHASAADLAREMRVDPAFMSRLVGKLRDDGILHTTPSTSDRRQADISLTPAGDSAFATLDAATIARVQTFLEPLDPERRAALVGAMSTIRSLLGETPLAAPVVFRPHKIGELGWLVYRQGLLYHQERGWNGEFEALIAGIYRDYEMAPPSPPKALWIAERQGAILGSIFVQPSEGRPGTAQLRMLYVEPAARGLGLGRKLVDRVVSFSRDNGYQRVRLWTQSALVPARKIYAAAGFALVDSAPHHSFGVDLVGENWELEL